MEVKSYIWFQFPLLTQFFFLSCSPSISFSRRKTSHNRFLPHARTIHRNPKTKLSPTHCFYSPHTDRHTLFVLDVQYSVIVEFIQKLVQPIEFSLFLSNFYLCLLSLCVCTQNVEWNAQKWLRAEQSENVKRSLPTCTMQMSTKALTAFKMCCLFHLFLCQIKCIKKHPLYRFLVRICFRWNFTRKQTNREPSDTLWSIFVSRKTTTFKEIWKPERNSRENRREKNWNKAASKWQNKNENRI